MHTFMERLQARGIRCIPAAEAESPENEVAESEAFETGKPSSTASSYLFGEFRKTASPYGWLPMKLPCRMW